MSTPFTKEKRLNHGSCKLDPEVSIEHNEKKINKPSQCLAEK